MVPNAALGPRVVVARNYVNRAIEAGKEVADLADQFPADAMVLKGIPGDKNKFRIRFSGKMLNTADGFDSGATDPLGRLPNMGGLHADLPIGRVNESHAESSAVPRGCSRTV
ncbi:hypothetical protein SBA3_5130001 [Candidatus Sulfopaludibacter sp. SbA3]|nr:hypothetical protein SBA3_5130001 [Candidatus Sulfopaludibacter sp. SbA3]